MTEENIRELQYKSKEPDDNGQKAALMEEMEDRLSGIEDAVNKQPEWFANFKVNARNVFLAWHPVTMMLNAARSVMGKLSTRLKCYGIPLHAMPLTWPQHNFHMCSALCVYFLPSLETRG